SVEPTLCDLCVVLSNFIIPPRLDHWIEQRPCQLRRRTHTRVLARDVMQDVPDACKSCASGLLRMSSLRAAKERAGAGTSWICYRRVDRDVLRAQRRGRCAARSPQRETAFISPSIGLWLRCSVLAIRVQAIVDRLEADAEKLRGFLFVSATCL